ncbi:MAG: alpha/beta hydrolase [Thermoplasmata archaeon]
MPSVHANGVELHYAAQGTEGDPVVLVHGSWVDLRSWRAVVPGLAGSMQVLVYDRRGHGRSTFAPRAHALESDAADLGALLGATDHYPAHLVGHSYGAMVALRLAVERPELVRSLSLHEPPYIGLLDDDPATAPEAERLRTELRREQERVRHGDPEGAARELFGLFAGDATAWERFRPETRAELLRYAPRWLEEFSDPATERPPAEPGLRELLIPILLTEGTVSPAFLHRMNLALERALSNPTVRRLRDAGHDPQITHPDLYVATLLSFLVERNVPTM